MAATVEQAVQARLIVMPELTHDFVARLGYRPDDPFAVRLTFPPEVCPDGTERSWTFARDLLGEGLRGPAGPGDVHIWPCGRHWTVVELHSPDGAAMIRLRSAGVRRFLARSLAAVPAGAEETGDDLALVLAALVGEG
ncbi:SsgA family sporulation/cell division regulator [Streptacidiphilus carbonis]|uniref:SsgA family sporulation/cell division regulator n=1 Tax=Streptacidiphilus carbonis TaxID=105422 RepID=UPI0005AB4D94|nr:SsgA family sporulation/cell division regulator [Streptacidiphilus carbonis]